MTYVHNGSEIHNDRFRLTVTDGKQNNSVVMRVKMDPVDDEQPVILGKSRFCTNGPNLASRRLGMRLVRPYRDSLVLVSWKCN